MSALPPRRFAAATLFVLAVLALSGCPSETPPSLVQPGLGPVEASLTSQDRTVYPGLDLPDGTRYVRQINGYFNGEQTGYWFFGFAARRTADAFFVCRNGDDQCPLDPKGHITWDRLVGDPVFSHIPTESGYSPFWVMWTVRVPADYKPNDIKSMDGMLAAKAAGWITFDMQTFDHGGTIGKDLTITHCAQVLAGTTLDRAGETLVNKPTVKMRVIAPRKGWHKQHQVTFFDFNASEGVSSPDPISQSRPLMRTSDIFVAFRDCAGGSQSLICKKVNSLQGSVSERGTETDFTNDGDKRDTNNVLVAFPYTAPVDPKDADRAYSPLWRVTAWKIKPSYDDQVKLVDYTLDQDKSAVKSVAQVREHLAAGHLYPLEFVNEGMTGTAIPGNDGLTFFSCPSQVAFDAP